MKQVVAGWRALRSRGIRYLAYLAIGYFVPKIKYQLIYGISSRRLRQGLFLGGLGTAGLVLIALSVLLDVPTAILILFVISTIVFALYAAAGKLKTVRLRRKARRLTRKLPTARATERFTSWARWPVGAETRAAVESARRADPREEIQIGKFDNDGRLVGFFGSLPDQRDISESQFVTRDRNPVSLVLVGDRVLVRKEYRGDRASFLREWSSLAMLSGRANVPGVFRVDEASRCVYKDYVPGQTVRNLLVDAGAKILTTQTDNDPELCNLDGARRIEAVWARGRTLLPSCLPEKFLDQLEQELNRIHANGVVGPSLTFGNVVVHAETGEPWIVDFDRAHVYDSMAGRAFAYWRDEDRDKFNRIYGRDLMTETAARAALAAEVAKENWYAPIDFGNGLSVGRFWSTQTGTGRWEFLNRQVLEPLVADKRILDLGCNNGVMPLMMLRACAKEVIGVELSTTLSERARLVHKIFEWRDMRQYAFRIHNCDMRKISEMDWGALDLVTAFNSLYYLPPDEMAMVVLAASKLAPIMVVQAKTDTRKWADDNKAEKSSVRFLKQLLEENGFPQVEVFTRPVYNRPLLVASCDRAKRQGRGRGQRKGPS